MRAYSLTAGAVLVCLSPSLLSAQTPKDDDLVGLWGTETVFGPLIRGELTLELMGNKWVARVGGFEASGPAHQDSVQVAFPRNLGSLRGRVPSAATVARVFWIQPAENLPSFATPVVLSRIRTGVWRGQIQPLDDRFSMYLMIQRDDSAMLRGIFRNPEVNFTGRAAWFRVEREANGEGIRLIDPTSKRTRFVQPYDSGQRRISMDFGALISLRPKELEAAPGFVARATAAAYLYRPPPPRQDGWTTGPASSVGLDERKLEVLVQRLIAIDPVAPNAPRVHSVLIARRGKLVLEEYFFGYSADRPHDLRSASKSFTSIMAGIAMDRGLFTLETPVLPLFGNSSPGINVTHLLSHSSGLACDDNDDSSPGNEDKMQQQSGQPDWYRYFADLPRVHEPGKVYAYCSAGMNLVGGVVAKKSAKWLPALFDEWLARPLQIERFAMNLMPNGAGYSGGGVHLLPRDFIKFGQLFVGGGIWNGRRVVSSNWVTRSTAHQIATPNGGSDGYGWHRYELTAGGRKFQEYEANGNGGQFLIVLPELEMVVAFTAGNYGQYSAWRTLRDELTPQYIIGAVVR